MNQPLSDVEEYIQFGTPPGADRDCDFLQNLIATTPPGSKTLLDLACGVGRHALLMARRGFSVIGVDLSPERIDHAATDAQRLGLMNCQFVVADLRMLKIDIKVDFAYSLFNTFSLFVDNDDLIQVLIHVRNCLVPAGLLLIQLGSLWSYIAEGKFKNDTYERTDQRGSLVRKETGSTQIARTNNLYHHNRVLQYTRDDVSYPARTIPMTQRIFSTSEWDLLCRLTGFQLHSRYTRMDVSSRIGRDDVYEGVDHDLILVLQSRP